MRLVIIIIYGAELTLVLELYRRNKNRQSQLRR